MPVRPSMSDLLRRLRGLLGDRNSPSPHFTDGDLQEMLDESRGHVRYLRLRSEGIRPPGGGTIQYLDFYADMGSWETNGELTDAAYNLLPPYDATAAPEGYTADWQTGHWNWPVSPSYVVHLTGYRYDLYGAAADALERWAGDVKLKFDFQTADQKLSRSQMIKNLLELAGTYRHQQEAWTGTMVRSDVR